MNARAVTRYAVANGNWNATGTWSATSGGTSGASVPVAGDVVYIAEAGANRTVTIPAGYAAACASVQIGNTTTNNSAGTLTFSASTSTLNLTSDLTIRGAGANVTRSVNVNAGTMTVGGNLNIGLGQTNTSASRICRVVITTGTVSVSGNVAFTVPAGGSTAQGLVNMSGGAGTFNLGGSITTSNSIASWTPGTTSTLVLNGTGAQTLPFLSSITYNHVTVDKSSGTASTSANTTFGGNVTLTQGTFSISTYNLNVAGNWTNNGGTFSATTGIVTFTGASKVISGSSSTTFGALAIGAGASTSLSSNASCTGLTFAASGTASSLTHTGTSLLTVNGDGLINQPTASVTTAWNVNGGSATVSGSLTVTGTSSTTSRIAQINITTGTLTIAGDFTSNALADACFVLDMSGGAGTINLGGNQAGSAGTYVPGTTSTWNFNGSSAQTIYVGSLAYANMHFNNTSGVGVDLVGQITATAVTGNVRIQSGIFTNGGYAITGNAGKTFEVANGATFILTGTTGMATGFGTKTFGATSTVEYGGGNQTVSSETYGYLILSSNTTGAITKTMPGTSLTVAGNFSSSMTAPTTSLSFTTGADIAVTGDVTIGSGTTFDGGSYSHSVAGNWTVSGTFSGSTSTVTFSGTSKVLGGTGTHNFYNLTVTGAGITANGTTNLTVAGNFATSGSGTFTHNSAGQVTMSGTTKTITGSGISFNDLMISGAITTTSTMTVTGNLSVGSSKSFAASAGTITMSGTSKAISNSGTLTFYGFTPSGSITTPSNMSILRDFTVTGTFTASSNSVSFIGTTILTGSPNLNSVILSGTKLQLGTSSIMKVAGVLTLTTGTFDVTTTTPNTTEYNGSGAQSVTSTTYDNLVLSGSNVKTAAGAVTVNRDLTISSGSTFSGSTYTHSLYGNWIRSGTFTPSTSTLQFLGSSNATVTGTTTFSGLTLNKSTSSVTVTLNNSVTTATLTMTQGKMLTGSNSVTITTTRTGDGIIIGTITHTHAFANGTAYAFEGPANTVTFSSGATNVSSITTTVTLGTVSDFPATASIQREYTNTVASSGTYVATFRAHYEDSELNGNSESGMSLWRNTGSWAQSGNTANDATSNWVEQNSLSDITGRWTCAAGIPMVRWNGSISNAWATPGNWTVVAGSASAPPTVADNVELGTGAFINNPAITTAVNVNSITFGSAQAVTLTIGAGGTLTTAENIGGSWTADRTHTIAVGAQTVNVGTNLELSTGTINRTIDLTIGTGTVTVNGDLTQSGGANITFSGAGNINLKGAFTYAGGTFTPGTGTVTYNGTGAQTVAAVPYYNLTSSKASGTVTVSSTTNVGGNLTVATGGTLQVDAALNVTGNVTIGSSATLNGGSSTTSVGGNWSNSGTFTPSTGTVVLNGTSSQTINGGTTTFTNLTLSNTSAVIYGMQDLNVTGTMTVNSGVIFSPDPSVVVNSSGVQGTLTGAGSVRVTRVASPATFTSQYRFSTNTLTNLTLDYVGTATQYIDVTSMGGLRVANANNVILNNSVNVLSTLTMNGGSIYTGSDTLTLGSASWSTGTLSRTSGYIIGLFRRWFNSTTVSNVEFPIGYSVYDRSAILSYTTAPTAGGTLIVEFHAVTPNGLGLPLLDGTFQVKRVLANGYWTINAGNSLSGGTYSLDLHAEGFNDFDSVEVLRILKRADSTVDWATPGSHVTGGGTMLAPVASRSGLSGFSEFGIGTDGESTLPVELIAFTGALRGNVVELDWRTASETHNTGFEIERGIPDAEGGIVWTQIGFAAGHGTTSAPQRYVWRDNAEMLLTPGSNRHVHYRLRQVDYDGTFAYSDIVDIELFDPVTRPRLLGTYPNPFLGTTEVEYVISRPEQVQLEICDILGNVIATLVDGEEGPGVHRVRYDAEALPAGMYYCRLTVGSYSAVRPIVRLNE